MAISNMEKLCRIAHRESLTIELPYSAKNDRLFIVVSGSSGKVIEQESVKTGEVVDDAARRLINRLRKLGIL